MASLIVTKYRSMLIAQWDKKRKKKAAEIHLDSMGPS